MKLKTVRGKIKSYVLEDIEVKSGVDGEYDFAGYASKNTKDSYDEIVDPTAFASSLAAFAKNPVMLYMHDPRQLIGKYTHVEIRHDGLFVKGKIDRGYDLADKARLQVEQGSLKALSIGFIPTKIERDTDDGEIHIRDMRLLEISPVSIPANQDALFQFDPNGKGGIENIILLDEEEAKLSDDELFAKYNGEAQTTASADDASAAEETPEDRNLGTLTVDLSGISEVAETIDLIGQAAVENSKAMIEELEIKVSAQISELKAALQATQAENQTLKGRVDDLSKTLITLIEGELKQLARARRITLAA